MSHFAVLVIGSDAEEQLEQYDENLVLPMHLAMTKEDMVRWKRQWIEDYKNGVYAEFLADPEKYKSCYTNPQHIEFLESIFPKMLDWTDEECYEDYINEYRESIAEGADWCRIDEDGNLWRNCNDKAKWDWYQLGGRFRGRLILKEGAEPLEPLYGGWPSESDERTRKMIAERRCDKAIKKDIQNWDDKDFCFFALLKYGEWYERGEMGWWCHVSNEKSQDEWQSEFRDLISDVPDDEVISVYDCHI